MKTLIKNKELPFNKFWIAIGTVILVTPEP